MFRRAKPAHRHASVRRRTVAGAAALSVAALAATVGVTAQGADVSDLSETAALSAIVGGDEPTAANSHIVADIRAARTQNLSRSDVRAPFDKAKARLIESETISGGQFTRTKEITPSVEDVSGGDPKSIAQGMLGQFGWGADQFSCLESLWEKESGWDPHADNPTSSAYGIPQALPGSKMASAGADWADNPATQIEWGLGYIQDTYGSPCSAWSHSQANNWY